MRLIAATLASLCAVGVQAGTLHYQVEMDNAVWTASGNARSCQLVQKLPRFGTATFDRTVGNVEVLKIQTFRPHRSGIKAQFTAQPPGWRPGMGAAQIGTVPVHEGLMPFYIEGGMVRQALTEMEQGMNPTLRYPNPPSPDNWIEVSLTALNFDDPYAQFVECVNGLVPNLDDIRHKIVLFDTDSSVLGTEAQEYLDLVVEYLKTDASVKTVKVGGHSDMKGTTAYNDRISKERAEAVKDYLTRKGILAKRIQTKFYGRTRPVADNKTEEGRAQNRRVEIELIR